MKTANLILSIAFGVALLACFIVNLATAQTLSWFYIVATAVAACVINWFAPQYIKRHKLFFVPLLTVFSICLIVITCAIYVSGWWCVVVIAALLAAWVIAFNPVYIDKYAPKWVKKHNANISIAIDAGIVLALLIVINLYTGAFGWCFTIGLPIILLTTGFVYLTLFVGTRKRLNHCLRVAIISLLWLLIINLIPIILDLFDVDISGQGMFWEADFSTWNTSKLINANVMFIVNVVVAMHIVTLFILGSIFSKRKRLQNEKK